MPPILDTQKKKLIKPPKNSLRFSVKYPLRTPLSLLVLILMPPSVPELPTNHKIKRKTKNLSSKMTPSWSYSDPMETPTET